MSEKTKRLLDDYETLKYESEHLKAENIKLKEIHSRESAFTYQNSTQQNSVNGSAMPSTVILCQDSRPISHLPSQFDTKESHKHLIKGN